MKIRLVARFTLPLLLTGFGPACEAASSQEPEIDEGSSTTMTSSSGGTQTGPSSDSESPSTSTGEPTSTSTTGSTTDPTEDTTGFQGSTGIEDTDGSTGGSTGGEDVGIDLPATIEMTFAFSGERAAALCNFLPPDSDQNQYYLSTSVSCGTGFSYASFRLNTNTGEYSARTGSLEVDGGTDPVAFLDWSHGDVGDIPGGGMSLGDLPEATDITLETTFHEAFTFRFDGNDLTVTVFDPK